MTLKVFVNPVVAALPEHAHLFPEAGCLNKDKSRRPCAAEFNESPLPEEYSPLPITEEMDDAWFNHIRNNYEDAYKK